MKNFSSFQPRLTAPFGIVPGAKLEKNLNKTNKSLIILEKSLYLSCRCVRRLKIFRVDSLQPIRLKRTHTRLGLFFWLNTFRKASLMMQEKCKASRVSAIGHLAGATNFRSGNKS